MRRLITTIISAILLAATVISYVCVMNGAKLVPHFGRDYTVLRIFDKDGFTPSEISTIRYAAESASEADADDDGRLWCDAYSYFTEVYVTRGESDGISCDAIVTSPDFFLFHDVKFKSGWYYTDTDLHRDRVVIDEKLAFELFGSNHVEDMSLTLNGKVLYVSGVAELDESEAKKDGLGEKPLIYIPQAIADTLFGERDFDNYEIMMQNPISSYAVNALASVTEGKTVVDVTNRYQVKKIFEIIKEFPTRSYRSEAISYPYWENIDRGTEDVLALLLVLNAVTILTFIFNLTFFIYERKKQ